MSELDDYKIEAARERYLQQNADDLSFDFGTRIGYVLQATLTAMDQVVGYTPDNALMLGEVLIEQIIHDQDDVPIDMIDWDALHAGVGRSCLAYRRAYQDWEARKWSK